MRLKAELAISSNMELAKLEETFLNVVTHQN